MASRKCKPKSATWHAPAPLRRAGGIGGVAPDGGNSGHSGTAKYAAGILDNPRPTPRPEKQGLCGQVNTGYYSGINGKSFRPNKLDVQYTSYQLEKLKRNARKLLHQRESRVQQGQRLRSMYLSAELPGR